MKGTCEPIDPVTGKITCGMYELFGDARKCPNFIENIFTPNPLDSDQSVKIVADCVPKRILLMLQELHNRTVALQQAQEELRNETIWTEVVAQVIGRNIGIDLQRFVEERQRLQRVKALKEDTEKQKQIEE
jgi:hypothetical protein